MANSEITKVDQNLAPVEIHSEGMKSYDINQPPFRIYGLCRSEGETDFKRLPHDLALSIPSDGIKWLYTHTSGGRIRFKTDSQRFILRCTWNVCGRMDHMPLTGSSCFDLYVNGVFHNVFRPGVGADGKAPLPLDQGYESTISFPDRQMRDILIHFPLYNNITDVRLALEEDAQLLPGEEYLPEKPVVYYGSSITQGGCASHGGNAYPAIIARQLNMDYINLGFSGNCKAEVEMANYIAGLEMSVFVYDYDHNAPTPQYLAETHERLFKTLRKAQPELPVVMISRADHPSNEDAYARKAIIRQTYDNAVAAGDQNVYFLDGETFYQNVGVDLCTVDGCHPTDLGFWCMAVSIGDQLKKILKKD